MNCVKRVQDLGVAAYLLMYGYKITGKEGKFFLFETEDDKEFESKKLEFLNSEFHRFDAALVSLKKMS